MQSKFETAANIATVGVAAVAMLMMVRNVTQSPQRRPPSQALVDYKVGQSIESTVSLDFSHAKRNVLLVVQEGCHFCEESLPFYREVIAERNRTGSKVQMVVLAPKRDVDISNYLSARGVQPDKILSVDTDTTLVIRVTPTLLVADESGRIVDTAMGLLSPERQHALLNEWFTAGAL